MGICTLQHHPCLDPSSLTNKFAFQLGLLDHHSLSTGHLEPQPTEIFRSFPFRPSRLKICLLESISPRETEILENHWPELRWKLLVGYVFVEKWKGEESDILLIHISTPYSGISPDSEQKITRPYMQTRNSYPSSPRLRSTGLIKCT